MNIGMVGLGKLGLPVAVALGQQHAVHGYDVNPVLMKKRQYKYVEAGLGGESFQEMFDKANLSFSRIEQVCRDCRVIFLAVQTPHLPKFEGVTRLDDERADFDYTYLVNAVQALVPHVTPDHLLVIISTCLPGTIRKHVMPVLGGRCKLVYNPFFIAMGTVIPDFYNPEFILLGGDAAAVAKAEELYTLLHTKTTHYPNYVHTIGPKSFMKMSIESAELTKVAYNTFIGMKISYANTMMEIAHKIPGCDVDDVMKAIKSADSRLISPAYLSPGLGDGGGCHPRDNIAMSWIARKLSLSHDIFSDIMKAREHQAEWLVNLMMEIDLPKVILGKSFKPETNIVTGSCAVLCANLLAERKVPFQVWDPYVDEGTITPAPCVYLIATKHEVFSKLTFPRGSVVIDPHRYIPEAEGVKVVWVGKGVA